MNKDFWFFNNVNKDNVALINERDEAITYQQLNDDIERFISQLPAYRVLIFLKVHNSYPSVVGYLACLRAKHPFLLIDAKVEAELLTDLINSYSPNYLIDELDLQLLNQQKYTFHPDLAMMLSTSGTTGTPKLVRLSHGNISCNTRAIVEYLGIKPSDCAITTLPMSYSYGLSIINTHLFVGARIVINEHSLFDPLFWEKVSCHQVATLAGVPFSFQLLKKLDYSRFDTSSIRYLTQAGGKLDNETLRYFYQACADHKQDFIVMYGQTEASPRMSYVPVNNALEKIGSIGIAVPGGRLMINDNNGCTVTTPFVEGEIVYQGKNVMLGYAEKLDDLQKGDEQNSVLATGDLGHFDQDGFFYVTGRMRRFIKIYGLRISLDAIDHWLVQNNINAITVGQDDLLVICHESTTAPLANKTRQKVAQSFKININSIKVVLIDQVPRVNGGKVDYKMLNSLAFSDSSLAK